MSTSCSTFSPIVSPPPGMVLDSWGSIWDVHELTYMPAVVVVDDDDVVVDVVVDIVVV